MADKDSSDSDAPSNAAPVHHALSSAGILASKILAQPFTIIASLVVANFLGPDEKGLAALSRVLPTFVASMTGFGIASSLKYVVSNRDKTLAQVGFTSVCLSMMQGCIAGLVFLAMIRFGYLGQRAGEFPLWLQMLSASIIPLSLLRQTLSMGFAGHMDFRITNVLDVVAGILFAITSVILVIGFKLGFQGVFVSYYVSIAFAAFVSLVVFSRKYAPAFTIDRPFIWFSYHYGMRAYLGTIAKRGNTSLDQFFIGVLAPSRALGNYSVAISIANFLFLLPQAIAPVLANQVAGLRGQVDTQKISQVHRALMLMQFVLGVGIAAAGFVLLPIMLPDFSDVPALIVLLLPGALFFSSFRILESYFVGIGKPERASTCHLIALVWSLISYPLLVPSFGGYGAAAACSINYVGMYVLIIWLYSRSIAPNKHQLFRFSYADVGWIRDHISLLLQRLPARLRPKPISRS